MLPMRFANSAPLAQGLPIRGRDWIKVMPSPDRLRLLSVRQLEVRAMI
jgi:hypothetical protein